MYNIENIDFKPFLSSEYAIMLQSLKDQTDFLLLLEMHNIKFLTGTDPRELITEDTLPHTEYAIANDVHDTINKLFWSKPSNGGYAAQRFGSDDSPYTQITFKDYISLMCRTNIQIGQINIAEIMRF